MYRATVDITFRAVHSLQVGPVQEQPHEHLWRARAVVCADQLDADGLVMDFRLLRRRLTQAVKPLTDADAVNALPDLAGLNPSTERLARYIHDRLAGHLPDRVHLEELILWETPHCRASYLGPARD